MRAEQTRNAHELMSLVDSYQNLTANLVLALADLSPKGRKVDWMLEQLSRSGRHEGTDTAISDFCRQDSPPARLMRLVSAAHARKLRAQYGVPEPLLRA